MIVLDSDNEYSKKLYVTVEISQLLYKYQCTYNEAEEILQLVTDEIKQQRDNLEYDTIDDYLYGYKTNFVDGNVIQPLNHVEPYC